MLVNEGEVELLVVERDDVLAGLMVRALVKQIDNIVVHTAHDPEDARMKIGRYWRRLDLAITDVELPPLERGEIVSRIAQFKIPSLVYCDGATAALRNALFGMKVIDVIQKEGPSSLEYLVTTVTRLLRNRRHTALVVDRQPAHRRLMAKLLERYLFNVLEAEDAAHAIKCIKEIPGITLAVIECNMPGVNGVELTKRLRARYSKDDLAIVGCSNHDNFDMLPKMLKAGANDIFKKPFPDEEFFCRACNAVEMVDNIHAIKLSAITDFLSGLYNRRHLFAEGGKLREQALNTGRSFIAGMADIDFFKKVNDTYGHDAGDAVIKAVAHAIRDQVKGYGMAARFGGEEFCTLVTGDAREMAELFEDLRKRIAGLDITFGGQRIPVTSSIGISIVPAESLDAQITDADKALYTAKQSGRNRVVMSGPDGVRTVTAG